MRNISAKGGFANLPPIRSAQRARREPPLTALSHHEWKRPLKSDPSGKIAELRCAQGNSA